MNHFTLLIFSAADEIIAVKTLAGRDAPAARRIAEHVMMTQPHAAGYQLWRKGVRVCGTFPQNALGTPLAFIAMRRMPCPRNH